MCNLHGVTLSAPVLLLNCNALSQSESSNFFMYIINEIIVVVDLQSGINSKAKK